MKHNREKLLKYFESFNSQLFLDFSLKQTELAEDIKPNCSIEIREYIKDLKNSIEV